MKKLFGLAIFLALMGCVDRFSRPFEPVGSRTTEKGLSEVFAEMARCGKEWDEVFEEWKSAGGGIASSMAETKKQIAVDKQSRFAKMVRAVWSRQQKSSIDQARWVWPIPQEKLREQAFLMLDVAEDYVSNDCATIDWLDPIIWDNLRFVDGDPSKFRVPIEAPANVKWDSWSLPLWVTYWIFSPPDKPRLPSSNH